MPSSARSLCDMYTYVYSILGAFTLELWDRDVLLKLISQNSIMSFALYFKVILEHMNNIPFG